MTSSPLLLVRLRALFVHNINLSLLGFLGGGGFPAKYKKKYMIQRFKFSKKIFSSTKKKTLIKKMISCTEIVIVIGPGSRVGLSSRAGP